jgi:hypothetical protein
MAENQRLDDFAQKISAAVEQEGSAVPAPRGRPWVKGQSGNPRGRPSRALQAARVANALIRRQTVPIINKNLELALAGDRRLLRDLLPYVAPPPREPPIDLVLPRIESRADLLVALTVIADAVASGDLTSLQGATLTRMLIAVRQSTW